MRASEREDMAEDEESATRERGRRGVMRGFGAPNKGQRGSDDSLIGLNALYFACLPIRYSPVNPFLSHVDPHSSSEVAYILEMARQGLVFLAPRCTKAPSVYSFGT